jgi:hypothetical protein
VAHNIENSWKKHINQNSGEKSGKRDREKTEREIPFEGGHV